MTLAVRGKETDDDQFYGHNPKARYGSVEMRVNMFSIDGLKLEESFASVVKTQANSVACMLDSSMLKKDTSQAAHYKFSPDSPKHGDPRTVLQGSQYQSAAFGEKESFYNEIAPGSGTGFLISKNLLLTAGHCVCKSDSNEVDQSRMVRTRILFGFHMNQEGQIEHSFQERDIYSIKEVIGKRNELFGPDWALVKLDRPVEQRAPLPLQSEEKVAKDVEVYMLGHPAGLPLKFTRNGFVKKETAPNVFETNLDAFAGNSGSPVFSRSTNRVVGILVSGNKDYEITNDYQGTGGKRVQDNQISDGTIAIKGYEKCQKISELPFVSRYLKAKSGDKEAQYLLGLDYYNGTEVSKNPTKALRLLQKSAYQGHVLAQTKFNEWSEEKIEDVNLNAPEHKKPVEGLSLESECENAECALFKQVFWINKGIGTFNIAKEIANAKCPTCHHQAKKIDKFIFLDCKFHSEGDKIAPKKEKWEKKDNAPNQKYKKVSFGVNETEKWTYFEVTTSKKV